jgi:hypothetical protein
MRRRLATACAMGLLPFLVSCSSSHDDGYCSALKSDRSTILSLSSSATDKDTDYLSRTLTVFTRLQKASPSELRDEWDTLVYAWQNLVDVVRRTGIDPSSYNPKHPPASLSAQDRRDLRDVSAALASPRVLDAVRGITDQAEHACKVNLSP